MSASDDFSFSPARRRLLLSGVAGAAVLTGAAVGWRRLVPHPAAAGADDSFWQMSFETPDGGKIDTSALRGRPLIVNFWATWCPPCIEELPLLEAFFREHAAQGWQVLGLAVDQPGAVQMFVRRMPLSFPVGLAGLQGTTLSRTLGNRAGGLPFSVLFGIEGAVVQRKMGRLVADDLRDWARQAR